MIEGSKTKSKYTFSGGGEEAISHKQPGGENGNIREEVVDERRRKKNVDLFRQSVCWVGEQESLFIIRLPIPSFLSPVDRLALRHDPRETFRKRTPETPSKSSPAAANGVARRRSEFSRHVI